MIIWTLTLLKLISVCDILFVFKVLGLFNCLTTSWQALDTEQIISLESGHKFVCLDTCTIEMENLNTHYLQ